MEKEKHTEIIRKMTGAVLGPLCAVLLWLIPIGTPPNIIMIGFLGPQAPVISFFQWMLWGTVAMILYFVLAYVVLWVAPSVLSIVYGSDSEVMKFYDSHFPEAIAAMIGGLLLFFLPTDLKKGEMTMSWKDGVEGIEWGTLLLFGGGLAMGAMMYTTGLSAWIGTGIKEALGGHPSE